MHSHSLTVYFHACHLGSEKEFGLIKIAEAASGHKAGSGCWLANPRWARDIQWTFSKDADMKRCARRMRTYAKKHHMALKIETERMADA